MASKPPSRSKRPFSDVDVDLDNQSKYDTQRKPRFPKGKKVKFSEEVVFAPPIGVEVCPTGLPDPKDAAEERARRRTAKMVGDFFKEDSRGMLRDISVAEVNYEADAANYDDGVQIEPFNLDQERKEGYFDANGNYVECSSGSKPLELIPKRRKKQADDDQIKDAWLDSVKVDSRFTVKSVPVAENAEANDEDLSYDETGKIKRRIANVLEPGETVLQALRRLKGSSNNRKERMSGETKILFDQLTEDSTKLMDNGEYNVYSEKQEVFEREAEGYERLAHARNILSRSALPSVEGDDEFDMFGDDDTPSTNKVDLESGSVPVSEILNTNTEGIDSQTDYVYDESSGYYYSSSLGYYYDPTTGYYCLASSGKWYSFNVQTGTYEEVEGGNVQGTSQNIQALDAQSIS